MYLLKYVNKTNPEAHISGMCIITDEELTSFLTKISTVKTQITPEIRFIFPVGQGFIQHVSALELEGCHSISSIAAEDLPILQKYAVDNMGFARQFLNGVINCTPEQFITLQPAE